MPFPDETGNRVDLLAHPTAVNTTLITHEEVQIRLSEAVASQNTRTDEDHRSLLSDLLAMALASTDPGPEAA